MRQTNQNDSKIHILFLCVANSARSQIAEGLAKNILGDQFWIESAGSKPSGVVHSSAIAVLKEKEIDISKHHSKSFTELSSEFMASLRYVITLCKEESCPFINSNAVYLHWPMPDPAVSSNTEEFKTVRDSIETKIREFAQGHDFLKYP